MIYVVEAVKGGVGKSTTALYLGEALARRGRRVLVVDADPQGTLIEWEAAAADAGEPLGVEVVGLPSAVLVRRRLATLAEGHDAIIVDCPNRDVGIIEAALEQADQAIVPMPPGVEELRRGRAGLQLAERVGIIYRVLLTMVDLRMSLPQDVAEVLDAEGIARFRAVVRRRAAIATAVGASRPQALHDYVHVTDELEVPVAP
ncbi:MAG: AAA family ATPase [Acidimicrobiales bacterium]